MREELQFLDRGDFLARRKAIYEEKYPESKQYSSEKQSQRRKTEPETLSVAGSHIPKSFTESTSEKTGISRTTIKEDIQISTSLSEEVKEVVKAVTKKKYPVNTFHVKGIDGVLSLKK